jgi:hypothetical protein
VFNTIGIGGSGGTVTIRNPLSNGVTITAGRRPLRVQLPTGAGFTEGAARVGAVAIIKHGWTVETQEWTRNVTNRPRAIEVEK